MPTLQSRRLPTAPVPSHLVLGIVLSSLSAVQNLAMLRSVGALGWNLIAAWWAASLLAFSSAFWVLPVWTRLRSHLVDVSPVRAWTAYCALFFVAGCGGGAVRQAIAAAWLPGLLGIGPARVFIFNAGLTTLICALFAEVPAEFFRRHREASDRRTALAAELDDVRARLVRDDDRARRELAEVLHGRLQSRLVAALAKLELARRADEPAIIARLLDEAASYTEEVRTEVLRQGGELAVHSPATCAEAVAELLARYGAMLPLSCTWQLGARELALAPEAVRVVYRLIDEALLNVYRHAHAAHVTLELAIADTGGLRVNLQDDGVGFEPDLVVQGIGLAGPGPVLERLGGRFGLRSKLGHGTTVVIELPPVGAL